MLNAQAAAFFAALSYSVACWPLPLLVAEAARDRACVAYVDALLTHDDFVILHADGQRVRAAQRFAAALAALAADEATAFA
jgi:hypothetical protein